jgi:hypothetical protein
MRLRRADGRPSAARLVGPVSLRSQLPRTRTRREDRASSPGTARTTRHPGRESLQKAAAERSPARKCRDSRSFTGWRGSIARSPAHTGHQLSLACVLATAANRSSSPLGTAIPAFATAASAALSRTDLRRETSLKRSWSTCRGGPASDGAGGGTQRSPPHRVQGGAVDPARSSPLNSVTRSRDSPVAVGVDARSRTNFSSANALFATY